MIPSIVRFSEANHLLSNLTLEEYHADEYNRPVIDAKYIFDDYGRIKNYDLLSESLDAILNVKFLRVNHGNLIDRIILWDLVSGNISTLDINFDMLSLAGFVNLYIDNEESSLSILSLCDRLEISDGVRTGSIIYDDKGRIKKYISLEGLIQLFDYDEYNNVTKIREYWGESSTESKFYYYFYDNNKLPMKSIRVDKGKVTNIFYNYHI